MPGQYLGSVIACGQEQSNQPLTERIVAIAAAKSTTCRSFLLSSAWRLARNSEARQRLVRKDASSLERYVRVLADRPLNRRAGESYEYSNANFVVLALLAQLVSGQSYDDYVKRTSSNRSIC